MSVSNLPSKQNLDVRLLLLSERQGLSTFVKRELREIALHVGALEREHKTVTGIAANALREILERETL